MYRRFYFVMICFLWIATVPAREYDTTRRISSVNGLSNDFVLSMTIDSQGYVWAATEAGVNRIAGETCQQLLTADLISGKRITALYWHASSGKLLIGTDWGMAIYNPTTNETQELTDKDGLLVSSINDITTADNGVWIIYGNGQIQKLDCSTLKVTSLHIKKQYGTRCAFDDGHGHLYIGHSRHGMSKLNLTDGSISHYEYNPDDKTSLPGNNVRQIYQDNEQRLWVGTDNGLALYHPQTESFSKVRHTLSDYDYNVYDILQMNDGSLWVATDIGGIKVLKPEAMSSVNTLYYSDVKVKLSSLNSRSILQDEYGNIWIGNHSTGIDFISAQKPDFNLLDYFGQDHRLRPVYAIAPDQDKGFFMAGENELSLWHDGKMTACWPKLNNTRMEYAAARCLMVDRTGHVWIGIDDQGAFRFDRASGKLEPIPIYEEGFDILSFAEDSEGRVWIGGEFSVYYYDNGKLVREETVSQTLKAPATFFKLMANQRLFVATLGDGAYVFDLKAKTSKHLSVDNGLPSNKINQTIPDFHKGLWLGTDGGLVYLPDPVNLTGMNLFNEKQGLTDSHIMALQQGADGRIWMSTNSGISCFDGHSGKFYNYNYLDSHLNGGFSAGASITDSDGTIYFGSASGVCYFNPQQTGIRKQLSEAQIIFCEAYNPVGINTEIRILSPDDKGRVYTTYSQNTLRLAFTVRNYAQTDKVEYSYMMKGMDNKWYETGNDHDVVFRGLRPGHYTFILRAKLKSQDWNEANQTQLEIWISPPFWRTWWAYLLYALAFILWAVWFFRSYKRKLALRSTLELERRESLQKQEMNEERLRFFTNITHELRTPLTLILGPLDDLLDDSQLPPQSRKRVAVIHKNAERLRSLIGQILEFRKTETRNRRLTVAKGDLGQFVGEICMNYKELYRNPKVQFSYHIANNLPPVWFDSEIITTIVNNLLSNAIKYTEEGFITTTVSADDKGHLLITVTDTGCGVAHDALPHIFERYYQAKGSHQASGTGIGLALVKSLADLHEAQIHAESDEGKGSKFTFALAVDNNYPDALHKEDMQPSVPIRIIEEYSTHDDEQPTDLRPTLLIVEDNADIRQYIADTFSEDLNILQSENGQEGLQLALENMPDIIVSDIMMPKLNGIQLTRQLKNDLRTSHIPIILLTAKTDDIDKEEGYDSGADSYLTKPFTARLLASRIQNLLTSRRRLAEYLTHQPAAQEEAALTTVEVPQLGNLDREFIDKLNRIISDHVMTQDLDLPFVTDKMAMSHSTFYRKVKALTGMTAKEYIRKRRLLICYQLLESGNYNVSQAAMMTGFNQMAHFRETFKKEFGILPSEVKKK